MILNEIVLDEIVTGGIGQSNTGIARVDELVRGDMIVCHVGLLVTTQVDASLFDGKEAVVHEAHIRTVRTGIASFTQIPVKKTPF